MQAIILTRASNTSSEAGDDIVRPYGMINRKKLRIKSLSDNKMPYPNGQADGFAFSTKDVLPPKTLRIVFEELERTGFGRRTNPNLEDWAAQGVMLLNTILTCTFRETLSHKGWGWEKFIAATLDHINEIETPLVVLAWGRAAQDLIEQHIMEQPGRLILYSCHPVAESYSEGKIKFVGCGHFIKAYRFLENEGVVPVNWTHTREYETHYNQPK